MLATPLEFKIYMIKFHLDWVVLPCQNRRNPRPILCPVPVQPFTSTSEPEINWQDVKKCNFEAAYLPR